MTRKSTALTGAATVIALVFALVGLGAIAAVAKETTKVKTSVTLRVQHSRHVLGHGEGEEGLSEGAQR